MLARILAAASAGLAALAAGTITDVQPAAAADRTAASASASGWSLAYRTDFGDLGNVNRFQSGSALNQSLSPTDNDNGHLQKPTLDENVASVTDTGADDGRAVAVYTRRASYKTTNGSAFGWTNGRFVLSNHDEKPPVRIRTRLRFTPSAHTKTAVMWWPAGGGWRWEVDFAETFGGQSTSDFWGGRTHVAQRWHGDTNHDGKAREQLAHTMSLDATQYHVYDLFITPSRMWVTVDGVQQYETSDKRFIPDGPGFFSVGKAMTEARNLQGRTDDAVYLDYLEIYKPGASQVGVAPPAKVAAVAASHDIRVDWTPSATGAVPSGYRVSLLQGGAKTIRSVDVGRTDHLTLANVNPGSYQVNVQARDDAGSLSTATTSPLVVIGSRAATSSGYAPVSPVRVLDTRSGLGAVRARIAPHGSLTLDLAGRHAVPSTATAALLNLTAVSPTASGWLSAGPAGATPAGSNLNFEAGGVTANLASVRLTNGKLVIVNGSNGTVDIVADLQGYYSAAATARYAPMSPVRVLDTRSGLGAVRARIAPHGSLTLDLAGRHAVPSTATAALLNLTAVSPTASGWLSAGPAGATPAGSNLNFEAGGVTANLASVRLTNGKLVIVNGSNGTVDIVADLQGYYS